MGTLSALLCPANHGGSRAALSEASCLGLSDNKQHPCGQALVRSGLLLLIQAALENTELAKHSFGGTLPSQLLASPPCSSARARASLSPSGSMAPGQDTGSLLSKAFLSLKAQPSHPGALSLPPC